MPSLLVTVGTDGSKDWVRTPDGQKFALGSVSVLGFVTKLSRNTKIARRILDEFLKTGEAMLSVDDSHMWDLLAPPRARWAAGPLMPPLRGRQALADSWKAESREVKELNALAQDAARTCDVLQTLLGKLGDRLKRTPEVRGPSLREIDLFVRSLSGFRSDLLGWGGVSFADREAARGSTRPSEVYESNMRAAREILEKARKTSARIDSLASSGKPFNASRARADVARVATRVASLCNETQLTEAWVRDDLEKLAARSDELLGLFHPTATGKRGKTQTLKEKSLEKR